MAFTATTLGVIAAACVLALAGAAIRARRVGRSRPTDCAERRRALLRDALRHTKRPALLAACEAARSDEAIREDVLVIGGGLALAPQRALLVVAVRAAGLDDDLRASLTDTAPDVRARAASLLGLLRLATSAELEPLLSDADEGVRLIAVRAIAMLDTPESARALIGALGDGRIDPPRLIEALARSASVPALVEALGDPAHVPARPAIAEALGLTGNVAAIGPLAALVRGGVRDERTAACRALARVERHEVVPLLLEALADDAWSVRAEAARGLNGLGDSSCVPELELALSDGAWWVRANAAEALRSIAPEGLDALERASRSDDPTTASHAREALALEHTVAPRDDGLGLAA